MLRSPFGRHFFLRLTFRLHSFPEAFYRKTQQVFDCLGGTELYIDAIWKHRDLMPGSSNCFERSKAAGLNYMEM